MNTLWNYCCESWWWLFPLLLVCVVFAWRLFVKHVEKEIQRDFEKTLIDWLVDYVQHDSSLTLVEAQSLVEKAIWSRTLTPTIACMKKVIMEVSPAKNGYVSLTLLVQKEAQEGGVEVATLKCSDFEWGMLPSSMRKELIFSSGESVCFHLIN